MFKFFKDGNKNAEKSFLSTHNILAAQKYSQGRGVKVGIVDWGFGNLKGKMYAGFTDVTGCGFINQQKEHGFAMANVLKQVAPKAKIYAINGIGDCKDDDFRVECLKRAVDFAIENKIKILTYSHPAIKDEKSVLKLKRILNYAEKNGVITVFIHCDFLKNIMPCPISHFKNRLEENMFNVFEYDFSSINPVAYKKWIESNKKDTDCFLSVSATAPVLAGCIALLLEIKGDLDKTQIIKSLNDGAIKSGNKKIVNIEKSVELLMNIKL